MEVPEPGGEQRRMKELKDALVIAQRRAQANPPPPRVETRGMQSTTVLTSADVRVEAPVSEPTLSPDPVAQPESPLQTFGSSDAGPPNDVMDIDNRCNTDGGPINAASQQFPGVDTVDSALDRSQIDHNSDTRLNQLLEHARTSDKTITRMAHQMSELSRVIVSMTQRGGVVCGVDPSVGQDFHPSTVAGQPTMTPPPSQLHARRIGPPGTFRNPVPPPIHKSTSANEFHVSSHSLLYNWS
jgi:hypothetical protein